MFERRQETLRTISQLLIGFCIVVFFVWFLAGQFADAAKSGQDAKKRLELVQLKRAIQLYELTYGTYPQNKNHPSWCTVGSYYGDKRCLFELTRDGFMSVLPTSRDEHNYRYISQGRKALIAVGFDDMTIFEEHETCSVDGVIMRCIEIH